MPYFTHRFPVRLGMALLLTATTLTSCGGSEKEPTAAEAGATLKTHIMKLLEERSARNIHITDSGGKDIRCDDGKTKRTFAATGEESIPEQMPDTLNDAMVGALGRVAEYHLTNPASDTIRLANDSTKTIIVLESSVKGQYAVRGETECLSQS
ncbi:hypothetical protein [Streptosporangium sp. 'caverna']|uniref:hypothetical protein n=1 Tax=Streptosporangium sp. 'caverna' TaxID=2202249 RepID=UPI0013A69B44|nr:hypothetical protein [Streptosporangium sp. 'caverna']